MVEINNGFILALALFRVHATTLMEMRAVGLPDLRINMGSVHLIEMEIPIMSKPLETKVIDFKNKVLNHIKNPPLVDWTIGDNLFKDCDDLFIEIDKQVFSLDKTEKKFN
jgi:hypothetical protein